MRKGEIIHKGRIIEMTPEYTLVEIEVSSACASCHSKSLCGVSESQEKQIMLPADPYSDHNVGDEVEVCTRMVMGMKAVWVSYAIPLLVLMILILTLSVFMESEVAVGLISIAGVCLYYFIIWLFRGKLRNEFTFYIK